jgi:amidase
MVGFVAEHVVSRTVRDSAAALDCTHGAEVGDPYFAPPVERSFLEEMRTAPGRLRIAFTTKNFAGAPLHPECVAAVEKTAKLCEELGHIVEEAQPPIDFNLFMSSFLTVFVSGAATLIEGFAMLHGRVPTENDFEGMTWGIYQQGKQITAPQHQIAVALLQMIGRQVARFHQTYDCWLSTTLGKPPIPIGTIDIHERDPLIGMAPLADYVPFTPLQNATGQPAISLPLHWSADGLPVGVMFTGRFGDEATLFRLAGQLEQARPWIHRKPKVWD